MFRKFAVGSLVALGLAGVALSVSSAQAAGLSAGTGAALADLSSSNVQPVWHHGRSHHWGMGMGWGPRPYWGPRCHWESHRVRRHGRWVRVSRRVCW